MLVKGCQRRVVFVKYPGNRYFDSAYFIMKSDNNIKICENDMLKEAQSLIDSCSVEKAVRKKKRTVRPSGAAGQFSGWLIPFISGAAITGIISGIIFFIAN